jgi:hypothetical protein
MRKLAIPPAALITLAQPPAGGPACVSSKLRPVLDRTIGGWPVPMTGRRR